MCGVIIIYAESNVPDLIKAVTLDSLFGLVFTIKLSKSFEHWISENPIIN